MEAPPTRYAQAGDVTIAYSEAGEGPPLIFVPGFISHVEINWETPFFEAVYTRLAQVSRLIAFDKRGTGLSDHAADFGSFEDRMDDIRAVMDAAGVERADLAAISEGGPLALLFAASYPERVDRIVLYASTARFLEADDYPDGFTLDEISRLADFVERKWGTGQVLRLWAQHAPDPETEATLLARLERYTATPTQVAHIISQLSEVDVRAVLPTVQMPTLVVHSRGDPMVRVAFGRYLGEHLPDATYVELDEDFHVSWLPEHADMVVEEFERFLTGTVSTKAAAVQRVLATVLFTDIVGSTVQAREMGDEPWRRVLDRHDTMCDEEVGRGGGRVIRYTGDGMLALFDGPARAIEAAQRIVGRAPDLGLAVRAGLHAGECDLRGDDVSGIAVHAASRVSDLADGGEVLTTGTVKDLSLGSRLTFEWYGLEEFKGFDEPFPVYRALLPS